jgi:hypothetical protein
MEIGGWANSCLFGNNSWKAYTWTTKGLGRQH